MEVPYCFGLMCTAYCSLCNFKYIYTSVKNPEYSQFKCRVGAVWSLSTLLAIPYESSGRTAEFSNHIVPVLRNCGDYFLQFQFLDFYGTYG